MKGQVMRPDDGRCRPHSRERRAAIALGWARTEWSQRQSQKARLGAPHVLVPLTERAVRSFAKFPDFRDRTAVVGECHWCFFWRRSGTHVEGDPRP